MSREQELEAGAIRLAVQVAEARQECGCLRELLEEALDESSPNWREHPPLTDWTSDAAHYLLANPKTGEIVWSREAIAEWLYQRGMQGGFPGDTENSRRVLRAHAILIQNAWFDPSTAWPPGYEAFKTGDWWVWHTTNHDVNEASVKQWKTPEEARVAAWADYQPPPAENVVEFRKAKEGETPATSITFTTSDTSQFVELVTVKPDGSVVLSPAFFEAVRAAQPPKTTEDAGITIIQGGGEGGIYDSQPWYASGGKWWGNAPPDVREKYQEAEPKGEPSE